MPTDQHGLALTTASDAAARHFDEAINQYFGYKHDPVAHLKRALADYLAQRLVYTARVQLGARAIGEHIYHPAGAHALARNSIMRALSAEDYYDRLAWLYGGTGLTGAAA